MRIASVRLAGKLIVVILATTSAQAGVITYTGGGTNLLRFEGDVGQSDAVSVSVPAANDLQTDTNDPMVLAGGAVANPDFVLSNGNNRLNTNVNPANSPVSTYDINLNDGDDVASGAIGLAALGISLDLDGGTGNDLLIGGDGVDTLRGGSGNDTLIGSRGNDVKLGEDGNDLLIWNNGDGSDLMEGGADDDTVQVNGANGAGDDFQILDNGARVRFQRNNLGLFTLDIGTTEDLDINGQGGDDVIDASSFTNAAVALDLDGGTGNDLLLGGANADVLRGGAGNDTLIGGGGNDVKLGEDGNDLLIWNNGDGSDLMEGGADDDTVQVNGADGAGDDISIDPNGARVRVQRNNLGLFALDIGTVENLDINGLAGNDVIDGRALTDPSIQLDLDGGAGNDFLAGGSGNDVLRGGLGIDTLGFGADPGMDLVIGFGIEDFLDVSGMFGFGLNPGDDLFDLGFLRSTILGTDTILAFTLTPFVGFTDFARLLDYDLGLGSTFDDPFLIAFDPNAVPEPGTWKMLLVGGLALLIYRRRKDGRCEPARLVNR